MVFKFFKQSTCFQFAQCKVGRFDHGLLIRFARRKCWVICIGLAACLSSCFFASTVFADEKHPGSVFAKSTIVFAKIKPPKQIVQQLLDHPLREKVESLPQVQQGLKSTEFVAFLAGLGFVEVFTGESWDSSLDILAGGGALFAFDAKQQAAGAVLISGDKKKLSKVLKGLLKLANQQNTETVQAGEYRDVKAYSIDKRLFIAELDDRILLSSKKEMVKQMVDYWLDQTDEHFALNESFQKTSEAQKDKTVWAWADLKEIRDSGMAEALFPKQAENIGAELLIGGIFSALNDSDSVDASLNITDDNVELSVSMPFDTDSVTEERKYFFGSESERQSFRRLALPNAAASIQAYRDIGLMWLSKEDLFGENHLSELSQADSTLSTLFAGLDFGEEVLGATKPGFQIVARNQNYKNIDTPQPDIKIPEFAFVFRLKDTEKVPRRFKVAYQSLIGFLNIQLAMQGNPQFDLESEKVGNAKVVSATYLPDDDDENDGLINYNFSPSIALVDDWFIISSTRALATDMAKIGESGESKVTPDINTSIEVMGKQVSAILKANEEQLIALNMLEEGNDRAEAKAAIGLLLNLVTFVKEVSLQLKRSDNALSLNFAVELDAVSKTSKLNR